VNASRRNVTRVLAALLALGLVAAACSSGDDDDDGGAAEGPDIEGLVRASDQPEESPPDETPQRGGRVVFAREAETGSPWLPYSMVCDMACHQTIRTVYEGLTIVDESGEIHPFLLESFEPNDDFTVWTLTARERITFHDGTPFDGEAMQFNLQHMVDSPLVGGAFRDIESVELVDPMTVEVTVGRSWSNFPIFLAGQPGYQASPTWVRAVEAGQASETEPVGTGPFRFVEFNPDSNFIVEANPDYWLEAPDGEPYPYLDEIEFVVQSEDQTRTSAMLSGEIDLMHMDSGDSIAQLRDAVEAGDIQMFELDERQNLGYVLINQAADAPVADVRIRRAMAMAMNQELRNEARNAGIFDIANGPFSPGSIGYLEDTGFPTFDLEAARELVEEYEAETGEEAVIRYKTVTDPFALETAELYQQFWEEAGLTVEIDQIEQEEFIGEALRGSFEAFAWRNHGGFDPDTQEVWWHSDNAGEEGRLALNFGRIRSDELDEQLGIIRTSGDEEERRAAAEEVNRIFADQVFNIWTDWVIWAIPHTNELHGVTTPIQLPDDGESWIHGTGSVGVINTQQLWVDAEG